MKLTIFCQRYFIFSHLFKFFCKKWAIQIPSFKSWSPEVEPFYVVYGSQEITTPLYLLSWKSCKYVSVVCILVMKNRFGFWFRLFLPIKIYTPVFSQLIRLTLTISPLILLQFFLFGWLPENANFVYNFLDSNYLFILNYCVDAKALCIVSLKKKYVISWQSTSIVGRLDFGKFHGYLLAELTIFL